MKVWLFLREVFLWGGSQFSALNKNSKESMFLWKFLMLKWLNVLPPSSIPRHSLKKKNPFPFALWLVSWAMNYHIVTKCYPLSSLHGSTSPLSRRLKGLWRQRIGLLKDGRQISLSNITGGGQSSLFVEMNRVQRWKIKCFAIIRFSKKRLTTLSWDSSWQNLF